MTTAARPHRAVVIGTSGSGKSTFAAALAKQIDGEHIELDAHFHMPGWEQRPVDEFRSRVESATAATRWVVDGNYSSVRDLVWSRADLIVWLDYSRRVTTRRILRRTLSRGRRSELLWGVVREDWRRIFHPNPEKNIVLWSITSYGRNRRTYTELRHSPAWRDTTWLRFGSPDQAETYLETLAGR